MLSEENFALFCNKDELMIWGENFMNLQKYKAGNCGLLMETNRKLYSEKDVVSKSNIDHEKSYLNYNLCSHDYTKKEIDARRIEINGHTKTRKDAVTWGGLALTLPKDYSGNPRTFFEAAYNNLKNYLKLDEKDIVSSYVHMDETTPHMHFYFIPKVYDEKKETFKVSGKEFFNRKLYQNLHKDLEELLKKELGREVHLLNGQTLGFDVQQLTAEEKRQIMSLDNKRLELGQECKSLTQEKVELNNQKIELDEKCKSLILDKNKLLEDNKTLIDELDTSRNELEALKGKIMAQKDIRERTEKKDLLGRSKGVVEVPYDEYQSLLHWTNRVRDAIAKEKELNDKATDLEYLETRLKVKERQSEEKLERLEKLEETCSRVKLKNGLTLLQQFNIDNPTKSEQRLLENMRRKTQSHRISRDFDFER